MKLISQKPLVIKYHHFLKNFEIIDKNRFYSNFGPLYYKTISYIKKILKIKVNEIVLTSSGDSGLLACLKLIKTKSKKKFFILPSFSFASDAQSILNAGFTPLFLDIDFETLVIDEKLIFKKLRKNKNIAGAIIVSPFGYPVNIERLNQLKRKLNIEIIYDAADAFLNLKDMDRSNFFTVCSFHPTKTLPSNESGMIICPNNYEKKTERNNQFWSK